MKTIDPMSIGWLGAQLHLVDAAQKVLQDASLALQAATNAGDEPARVDGLRKVMSMAVPDYVTAKMDLVEVVRKALYGPAGDPFTPFVKALTEYYNLDTHSRARRQIDAITTSFDASGALDSLHVFIGYLDALFDEKLLGPAEHDVLLKEGEQAWRDWKPIEGAVDED